MHVAMSFSLLCKCMRVRRPVTCMTSLLTEAVLLLLFLGLAGLLAAVAAAEAKIEIAVGEHIVCRSVLVFGLN